MMKLSKHFKNTLSLDFFQLFTGKELGSGVGRRVYEHALDDSLVIKFETRAQSFQNIMEWETWEEVAYCPYKKHFAPCVDISPCGLILIMKRTRPVVMEMLPKSMPSFFCDFKSTNYGMLDGKLVCHDYGYSRLLTQGLSKKMRKANWFE